MKQKEKSKFQDTVSRVVEILNEGGVVIFPTDTVYGIGCRYDNDEAIQRLYYLKRTPKEQKFPLLVSNVSQVERLAEVDEVANNFIHKYWPGALTIILNTKHPGGKLGFRMPNSTLVLSIIEELGAPLIGTSANFHGDESPVKYEDLDPQLIEEVEFLIKGECKLKKESTVVDLTSSPPRVLRQGVLNVTFD